MEARQPQQRIMVLVNPAAEMAQVPSCPQEMATLSGGVQVPRWAYVVDSVLEYLRIVTTTAELPPQVGFESVFSWTQLVLLISVKNTSIRLVSARISRSLYF
jgi:hypothetical protein